MLPSITSTDLQPGTSQSWSVVKKQKLCYFLLRNKNLLKMLAIFEASKTVTRDVAMRLPECKLQQTAGPGREILHFPKC